MSAITRRITVVEERLAGQESHNRLGEVFGELAWETAQIFPTVIPANVRPHWTPARILEVERRWPT